MALFNSGRRSAPGFTLIELLVVMAIIGMLVSIAAPRYFHSIERARETSLRGSLTVMRGAIDQFAADKDRYPDTLDELVAKGYMRSIPADPFTHSATSWLTLPPPPDSSRPGQVADVRSGMSGTSEDGSLFTDW